ncbi:peptide chain release factor N(5)-glutamine methyltransferase [Globicatella sanguinis]|uniref:peptide chain release factor N(5)-glutamine methyltransferase n=1 Tax=Globicatella sanguinis TaxID=13076 RepID=UPI00082562D3|nr:peptide chain release factor N(5)-glutamine methyltransferase [Globicatella sanguinis]
MVLSSKMTLAEALHRASVFLQENGINDSPIKDYWQRTFDWNYTQLILNLKMPINDQQAMRFNEVLKRLAQHEPIQYIIGKADFVGETYYVTPDTLIPREDTYGLIEMGCDFLKRHPQAKVLDIGTGSGIIAIELAKQLAPNQVTAVDISPAALAVAQKNGQHHQVQVEWLESDLMSALTGRQFDLIVSNPPYIAEDELALMDESVKRFEPATALFAEQQGLAIYQRLAETLPSFLSVNGQILLEIGFKQASAVQVIFQKTFHNAIISVHQDLNGLDRYIKIDTQEG